MSHNISDFQKQVLDNINRMGQDRDLKGFSNIWQRETSKYNYVLNYSWMGRPIIQFPQDVFAMQEIIWNVQPDLIIETGIAHGGSLIMSASILAMLDHCDAVKSDTPFLPQSSRRKVLGIDIDIRSHNREAIESHPMSHFIKMIQGSSTDSDIIAQVHEYAANHERILICLDSNHTHDHVLAELEAYAPLTSINSYCVVFDTAIEDMPDEMFPDRPWGKGNNPKTAVREYLRRLQETEQKANDGDRLFFEIDKTIDNKLLITSSPDGYLKRIRHI